MTANIQKPKSAWHIVLLCRAPEEGELWTLVALFEQHRAHFEEHPEAASLLLAVGESKPPPGVALPELAAWTSVCRVILNLPEAITRY